MNQQEAAMACYSIMTELMLQVYPRGYLSEDQVMELAEASARLNPILLSVPKGDGATDVMMQAFRHLLTIASPPGSQH